MRGRQALDSLYDDHVGGAFAVAWAILGTKAGAEGALVAGTVEFWRYCADNPAAIGPAGWLCRVGTHALDDRRLGHGNPGPLSELTETQSQLIALTDAGGLTPTQITQETGLSHRTIERTVAYARAQLADGPLGGSAPPRRLRPRWSPRRRSGPPGACAGRARPDEPRPLMSAPPTDRRPREQVAPIIHGEQHDYYRPRPPQTDRARQAAAGAKARRSNPTPAPAGPMRHRRVGIPWLLLAGTLVALMVLGGPRSVSFNASLVGLLLLASTALDALHRRLLPDDRTETARVPEATKGGPSR